MTKTLFLGAAAALLLSGSALAQDTSATPPGPTSPAPTNNNPATGYDTQAGASSTGAASDPSAAPPSGPTSGYSDSYGSTAAPPPALPPAGAAGQYGTDTSGQYPQGAPYNPLPAPSQSDMYRSGERG